MHDRIAVVTGAGRGIGAAIAEFLAGQGLAVAVLDVEADGAAAVARGINARGGQALALPCDVTRRTDVEAALHQVEEAWGTPLVLVNNAGVGGPFHRADAVSDDEWDWVFNTNVRSAFYFCRALLPGMQARGHGRIVNIASIQGLLGAAGSSTYAASKHAVIGYTRALAAEWGPYGITCNAVCPGYVDTAMGVQAGAGPDHLEQVLARTPVRRMAAPVEIAALVWHLVGPHGGYINGVAYAIDGGISAHVGIDPTPELVADLAAV